MISSLLLLLISCDQGVEELTDEKLAQIIADMHISEIALDRQDDDLQDSLSEIYLTKIEEIHKVDRAIIKENVEKLMEDRSRQSEIYGTVITILQDLEQKVKEQNAKPPPYKNKDNG